MRVMSYNFGRLLVKFQ